MDVVVDRVAGLDVGKALVTVCVRTPGSGRSRNSETRTLIAARRGAKRAAVAVAHSILVSAFHMLDRDEPYRDLGPDWFTRDIDPAVRTRRLATQLERLGHTVTLAPAS